MNPETIRIRELAGWDFDGYEYRPKGFNAATGFYASQIVAARPTFESSTALLYAETAALQDFFALHEKRDDLHFEMSGLQWSLGVVDLRLLLAFQRRVSLNSGFMHITPQMHEDWSALFALSFGPPKPSVYDLVRCLDPNTLVLQSSNPNLQLRLSDSPLAPITIHPGSPFFEVASYRGRWFLRDGFHRAYNLLRAGIVKCPAVIVHARTLEELGAIQPWFFSEETLFSSHPPYVVDFINDDLIFEYDRPLLTKTLRITLYESFAPATPRGEQP